MNTAMAISVVMMLGAVLGQARGQGKGEKDKEGNRNGVAPRLAPLARGDDSNSRDLSGNRVQHSYVQHLKAAPDRVFAVLEPVEEVKWAPGFEFRWAYAKDGAQAQAGQQGDVFVTRHGEHEVVWVISRRDAEQRIVQFVRFFPGVETVQIDIHVTPDGQGSACAITYTWTAWTAHGRERLKQHTRAVFVRDMQEWEQQVDAYLGQR